MGRQAERKVLEGECFYEAEEKQALPSFPHKRAICILVSGGRGTDSAAWPFQGKTAVAVATLPSHFTRGDARKTHEQRHPEKGSPS